MQNALAEPYFSDAMVRCIIDVPTFTVPVASFLKAEVEKNNADFMDIENRCRRFAKATEGSDLPVSIVTRERSPSQSTDIFDEEKNNSPAYFVSNATKDREDFPRRERSSYRRNKYKKLSQPSAESFNLTECCCCQQVYYGAEGKS